MSHQEIDVSAMNVEELRRKLVELELSTSGNKPVLRERLRAALNQVVPSEDDAEADSKENDDEDSDAESDNEDEVLQHQPRVMRNRNTYKPALLTFKDVEESMEKFSGDDHVSVKAWLTDFEDMARMCQWADIQKVAYAKRLLAGSAKLFVKYEKCTRTWSKLKDALKDEFEEAVDEYQVHRQLTQRKKKPDETHQEYIYKMLDIGSQADVAVRSVIQYIIDGIPDDPINKAVLYGAKNIRQLKEKMAQYETMKRSEARLKNRNYGQKDDKVKSGNKDDRKRQTTDNDKKVKHCFVCGAKDHLSAECPVKDKGIKCFKCNEHGHIAAKCPSRSSRANQVEETNSLSQSSRKKHLKEVSINNIQLTALIDTGSDLTLMRVDEYAKIGSPRLIKSNVKFDGIGSSGNETIGEFVTNVKIDDVNFNVKFHVVSGSILKHAVLMGTDFLSQVELNMSAGKIKISKIITDSSDNADVPYIFQINAIEEADALNVVENTISNYNPEKTREVVPPHEREEVDKIVNDEPLLVVPKCIETQVVKRAHERGYFGIVKEEVTENAKPVEETSKAETESNGTEEKPESAKEEVSKCEEEKAESSETCLKEEAMEASSSSREKSETSKSEKENKSEVANGVENGKAEEAETVNGDADDKQNRDAKTDGSDTKVEEHLNTVEKYLNATPHRATGQTPFKLLFGAEMRLKDDPGISKIIEEEWVKMFEDQRDEIRRDAKDKIRKVQKGNLRTYNKKRKRPT